MGLLYSACIPRSPLIVRVEYGEGHLHYGRRSATFGALTPVVPPRDFPAARNRFRLCFIYGADDCPWCFTAGA